MIKIAVFDCGFGGEMLADRIKEELPFAEVIRIIDWRHAKEINGNPRLAREYARNSISPYIEQVDVIVLANFLLTITSLNYFKRRYKNQKFVGMSLKPPDTFVNRNTIILTSSPVSKTLEYIKFVMQLKRKIFTLKIDDWDAKIDDGELTEQEIKETIGALPIEINNKTAEIILAHANLPDIKPVLKKLYGQNFRIYDSINDTIRKLFKELGIRGGIGRKK